MRKDFGVGGAAEGMTSLLEISAQLAIVIDFAVQDYGDAVVFVEYRLLSGDEVDDCEPPHSERDTCGDEQALGVRAAMSHPLAHCMEQLLRAIGWRRVRIETSPSSYSAHVRES